MVTSSLRRTHVNVVYDCLLSRNVSLFHLLPFLSFISDTPSISFFRENIYVINEGFYSHESNAPDVAAIEALLLKATKMENTSWRDLELKQKKYKLHVSTIVTKKKYFCFIYNFSRFILRGHT